MNSHQADEMSHRERDSAERHHRDTRDPAYPAPTGTPHHSNAGSLPIHQPVASRLAGTIHSPGGLLASHGSAPPPLPIGGHSSASFPTGPLADVSNRPPPQNVQNASNQMFNAISGPTPVPAASAAGAAVLTLGPPLQQENSRPPTQGIPFGTGNGATATGPPVASGAGALQQGQQPILNVSFILFFNVHWMRLNGKYTHGGMRRPGAGLVTCTDRVHAGVP